MTTTHRPLALLAAALLACAAPTLACASTSIDPERLAPPPRATAAAWTAVRCTPCERAGLAVELRRAADAEGREGRHLMARVRNATARPMSLVLDFTPDEPHVQDGYVPAERWRVVLAPAGTPGAEQTLWLRSTTVAHVGVERAEHPTRE